MSFDLKTKQVSISALLMSLVSLTTYANSTELSAYSDRVRPSERGVQMVRSTYPGFTKYLETRRNSNRVLVGPKCSIFANDANDNRACKGMDYCVARDSATAPYKNTSSDEFRDVVGKFQIQCLAASETTKPSEYSRSLVNSRYPELKRFLNDETDRDGRFLENRSCAVIANDRNNSRLCSGKMYCVVHADGRPLDVFSASADVEEILGIFKQQCMRNRPSGPVPSEYARNLVNSRYPELKRYLERETTDAGRVLSTRDCGVFANDYMDSDVCDGKMYCVAKPNGRPLPNGVRGSSADYEEVLGIFKKVCRL